MVCSTCLCVLQGLAQGDIFTSVIFGKSLSSSITVYFSFFLSWTFLILIVTDVSWPAYVVCYFSLVFSIVCCGVFILVVVVFSYCLLCLWLFAVVFSYGLLWCFHIICCDCVCTVWQQGRGQETPQLTGTQPLLLIDSELIGWPMRGTPLKKEWRRNRTRKILRGHRQEHKRSDDRYSATPFRLQRHNHGSTTEKREVPESLLKLLAWCATRVAK